MLRTIEATIDEHGTVTLNEGVVLPRKSKALVTILDDVEDLTPALQSEKALADGWSGPEEDAAWAHLSDLPAIAEEKQ